MNFFGKATNFNFMRLRFAAFVLSSLVICGGIGGIFLDRMKFGIDFTGGVLLEVDLGEVSTSEQVRNVLSEFKRVKVQEFGQEDHFLIRMPYPPGEDSLEAIKTIKEEVLETLKGEWGEAKYRRVESVGAKVSGELMTNGLYAVGAAILAMLIYIWARFKWTFSIGAVAALSHDILFALVLFVVTGIEFDLASLAALLTIIGYSINDTVVIFDRLREVSSGKGRSKDMYYMINKALNETLSRTIVTSATTILALVIILLLGGPVLFPFVLIMIVGIFVGTYSSMFVAAPVLFYLSKI